MKHINLRPYIESSLHVALSLWAFCNVLAMQQGVDVAVSLQCAIFGFGWVAYQYFHFVVPALVKRKRINLLQVTMLFCATGNWYFWTRHTNHCCLVDFCFCRDDYSVIHTSFQGSNGLALYPYS
jgi:hypothetical protein